MNSTRKFVWNGSIALIAFVLLALPMVTVKAADLGDGWDFYPDASYDFYPDQSYDFYPDEPSYDFYPEETSYDFYPDEYWYGSGYPVSSFVGSGYLGGGYVMGSGYLPYTTPARPVTTGGGQTQTQTSVNNNTNVNNNIITVHVPSPTVVYTTPVTPVYNNPVCTLTVNYNYSYGYQPVTLSWTSQYATSGYINNGIGSVNLSGSITVNPQYTTTYTATFYGQNGQSVNCSATVTRGVVYNNTPYVALSAVPYTGLELGFWGTLAYFGFLVLWCLVAAYLIVVKKVQNHIFSFLFGTPTHKVATVAAAPVATATTYSAPKADAIDDFIMSQVYRSTR